MNCPHCHRPPLLCTCTLAGFPVDDADTPETNAAHTAGLNGSHGSEILQTSRRLERERDVLRARLAARLEAGVDTPVVADASTMLCRALNKLIWKCPMPDMIAAHKEEAIGVWAEYWLGELRDGPDGCRIEGIEWYPEEGEFVPAPPAVRASRLHSLEALPEDVALIREQNPLQRELRSGAGRPPRKCETHPGAKFTQRADGRRLCVLCHPARRGRPARSGRGEKSMMKTS